MAACRFCQGEEELLEISGMAVCQRCLTRGLAFLVDAEDEEDEPEGPWRYSVGEKGVNRVTVWENPQTQVDNLYVTWWDENRKRHREVLEDEDGNSITDRNLAKMIAETMSQKQRVRRGAPSAAIREVLGLPNPHTLGELYEALFAARKGRWGKKHKAGQERMKKFWLEKLGKDTRLTRVTAAEVERHVNEAASERGWAATTKHHYLRHLKDTFIFAEKKLNWIAPEHNLSEVDLPQINPHGDAYTDEEIARLIVAALRFDLRMAALLAVCHATARRINAVRQRKVVHYRTVTVQGVQIGILRFEWETDKAKKTSDAVLTPTATALVGELLELPAVQATGWLFPAGELESEQAVNAHTGEPGPLPDGTARDWLHKIEEMAGVEWVKGRAFHGVKRSSVTIAGDETGDMGGIAQQSGTNVDTLLKTYRQHSLKAKLRTMRALEESLEGQMEKPPLRIVQ